MNFSDLGLSAPLLTAIKNQGYETPTPIQAEAIPLVLEGKDVMAAAQTGTGKTAAFTLPLLDKLATGDLAGANQVRALILAPTRELAAQVEASVKLYSQDSPLRSAAVFGGVKINPQMKALRRGVDILVATPGRLLDLYRQNAIKFNRLDTLILDEADRMLDMGFLPDITTIIGALPKDRQNLMFSATFSGEIQKLAKSMLHQPVEVSVSPRNTTVSSVKQRICPVDQNKKADVLVHMIKDQRWNQLLVFVRTKHGANRLSRQLEKTGLKTTAIHGNKTQAARTKALTDFKKGRLQILVATDIAARGLDIDDLPCVVNFDLPQVPEDYIHRIGRTGRAGATGEAISLVCASEFKLLSQIERLTKAIIERLTVEGFEPVHNLPESRLTAPKRAHRPKHRGKPKAGHRDGQRSSESARGHKPRGENKKQRATDTTGGAARGNGGGKPAIRRSRNPNMVQKQAPRADVDGNR